MKIREFDEQLFNDIQQRVFALWIPWDFYQSLYGSKRERVELLNEVASGFFGYVQELLGKELAMEICKLLDPAKTRMGENHSIARLLWEPQIREPEDRVTSLENEVQELESCLKQAGDPASDSLRRKAECAKAYLEEARKFQQATQVAEPLRTARNKRIAHSDMTAYRAGDDSLGFTVEDVKAAMEAIADLLQLIERHETGEHTLYQETITENSDIAVLRALQKAQDYDRLHENGEISTTRLLWAISEDEDKRHALLRYLDDGGVD